MDKALQDKALDIKTRMRKLSNDLTQLYAEAEEVKDEIDADTPLPDEDDPDADENPEIAEYEAASDTLQDWLNALEAAIDALEI